MATASKTFTSYSHDSQEHKDRTLALSNRLRDEGVDCNIDQYESSPREGWPLWMMNQIGEAEFVLVICTKKYFERYMGKQEDGPGKGGTWEGAVITQEIYDGFCKNLKFVPVIFCKDDEEFIPMPLRGATYYCLDSEEGYIELYRRLTNQAAVLKPALGRVRYLPAAEIRNNPAEELADEAAETLSEIPTSSGSVPDPMTVLLSGEDGSAIIVRADRIDSKENLTLILSSISPRDASFLEQLKKRHPQVGMAFDNTGIKGRVLSASSTFEEGRHFWSLEIQPSDERYGGSAFEMSCGNYSADDIAEMRARRILLDEKPDYLKTNDQMTLRLNNAMLEAFIQGIGTSVKVEKSIIPILYKAAGGDTNDFLVAAKLFSVLLLHTSGVVEHIHRLDMEMHGESELAVSFEGQRPRIYSNAEPTIIKVDGMCKLK